MKSKHRTLIAIGLAVLFAVGLTFALKLLQTPSLESGHYLVAQKEFVGPKDQVKEYKEAFLFGQLMDQMEHQEDVVYAVYDKASKTLKVHTLDEIKVYQVNEEDVSFSGPDETETLLKLKGTSFTIQDSFVEEINLNIRMDKVKENDPKIVEYKQLIEAEKIAKAEQQAKYKEQLNTPAEGIKIRVGDTETGVVVPIWAKFIESETLDSGASRYIFKNSRDVFSKDLQFFLATTPEQVKKLESDLFYTDKDNIIFDDGSTQLVENFKKYISVAKIETQEGTLFSYGSFEDPIKSIDWARALKSANSYKSINAPDLADLVENPELFKKLIKITIIDENSVNTCIQKLHSISQDLSSLLHSKVLNCKFTTSQNDIFSDKPIEIDVDFSLSNQDSTNLEQHIVHHDDSMSDEEKNDNPKSLYVSEQIIINQDDFLRSYHDIFQSIPINKSTNLVADFNSKDIYSLITVIHALKKANWHKINIPEKFNRHFGKYTSWFPNDESSEYFFIKADGFLKGVISRKGDTIVPPLFKDIRERDYGFIVTSEEEPNKKGIYNMAGEILLPVKYSDIRTFNHEYLEVEDFNGSHKLFNILNNNFLPINFEAINKSYILEDININYVIVSFKDGLNKIYDLKTKKYIPINFLDIETNYRISESNKNLVIITLSNQKKIIYDLKKHKKIYSEFDELTSIGKSEVLLIENNELYTLINADLSSVTDEKFNSIKHISHNNFIVEKNNTKGIIIIDPSLENHITLNLGYQEINMINNYTAWAKKNDKWGLIDLEGDIRVPFEYDIISDTQASINPNDRSDAEVALVKKDEKFGVINWNTGEELTTIDFNLESERPIVLKKDNTIYRYPRDFIPRKNTKPNRFHRASPASN